MVALEPVHDGAGGGADVPLPGDRHEAQERRQAVRQRGPQRDEGLHQGEARPLPTRPVGAVGRLQPGLQRGLPGARPQHRGARRRGRRPVPRRPAGGADLPRGGSALPHYEAELRAGSLAGVGGVRRGRPEVPQARHPAALGPRRRRLPRRAPGDGDLHPHEGGLQGLPVDRLGHLRQGLQRADAPAPPGAALPRERRQALPCRAHGGQGLQHRGLQRAGLPRGRVGRVGAVLGRVRRGLAGPQPPDPAPAEQRGQGLQGHLGRVPRV
mmetsp:Transcript_88806/g.287573  ORF Transcript_88806/g.287573 Transcript_88806/m.287573 type:complete len:268 (+) Transcript_88806:1799-2602(+)